MRYFYTLNNNAQQFIMMSYRLSHNEVEIYEP